MIVTIDTPNGAITDGTNSISITLERVRGSDDKTIINVLIAAIRDNHALADITGVHKSICPKTMTNVMSIFFSSAWAAEVFATYLQKILTRYGCAVSLSPKIKHRADIERISLDVKTNDASVDMDKIIINGCLYYRLLLDGKVVATSHDPTEIVDVAFIAHECNVKYRGQ